MAGFELLVDEKGENVGVVFGPVNCSGSFMPQSRRL